MHQGYFSLVEKLSLPSFYEWEYAGNKQPEPGSLCSSDKGKSQMQVLQIPESKEVLQCPFDP